MVSATDAQTSELIEQYIAADQLCFDIQVQKLLVFYKSKKKKKKKNIFKGLCCRNACSRFSPLFPLFILDVKGMSRNEGYSFFENQRNYLDERKYSDQRQYSDQRRECCWTILNYCWWKVLFEGGFYDFDIWSLVFDY